MATGEVTLRVVKVVSNGAIRQAIYIVSIFHGNCAFMHLASCPKHHPCLTYVRPVVTFKSFSVRLRHFKQ